jgi:alpha-L-fucosidase
MGWPEKSASIKALAANDPQQAGRIHNVELLGHKGNLKWTQDESGLKVDMPSEKPCDHAVTLKIVLA